MKVLIHWWQMGAFPVTVPFKDGEDDPRRAIEVPDDLHERFVEAHEEFCAVLSEIDVQCVEILDAPHPDAPRLPYGRCEHTVRHGDAFGFDGYEARCESCAATAAVPARIGEEEHGRALGELLDRGWRERRHGGLACPTCAPQEILLPAPGRGRRTPDRRTGTVAEDDRPLGAGGDGGILTGGDPTAERREEAP